MFSHKACGPFKNAERRVRYNDMAKVIEFVKETRAELRHVAWPTRKQVMSATALVIGISIFVALFLTLFDWLFSLGLKAII